MIKVIPDLADFEKAPVFCWSDPVQKKKKDWHEKNLKGPSTNKFRIS